MTSKKWLLIGGAILTLGVAGYFWRPVLFTTGGAMATLGHSLQDLVSGFRMDGEVGTPQELLDRIKVHNAESSWVRAHSPEQVQKPEAVLVMCIDPRLDAKTIMGDTRDYYDVIRLPGSVLSAEAIEAIELGVKEHEVKLVIFTRHTNCAMEAVAHSGHAHEFPALSAAVKRREQMYEALLQRPIIAQGIASGELLVERFAIDTSTGALIAYDSAGEAAPH